MASTQLSENGDCYDSAHVEKLLPPDHDDIVESEVSHKILSDSYDEVDRFGEPEIPPRIGNEYQVELPPLIGEFGYMSRSRKSGDAETGAHTLQNFLIGLPIPLAWISGLKHDMLGSHSSSITSSDFMLSDSKNVTKTETSFSEIEPSHDSCKPMEELQDLSTADKVRKCSAAGYLLVPGLFDEYWSAAEKDGFLLGLYIFEKNFVEVRRFVGTKDMGALLSFYYGQFYGTQEYRRWSECRKMKNKKVIYGQRIFSGVRQQELLSRILPRVSEECRNALLEVSKTFGDEKMSLADYVSSLKAMVGMNILVEAVGIGKGKQDLTGMALEPSRSNQVIPARPEIPTGKACSSLTTTEIIKFLSGDYRLSKARSNDLFWEAVWPRLLARGWHSEQPKDQGYVAGSKHCLVFLMPGVKKFSRRKLVKGDHYFDSVTDVLSKVAKNPGLIELDAEEDHDSKKKEDYERTKERKSEQDDNHLPTRQQHCYLQPRTPNRSTAIIKFTVVDTSLSDGKVRELRTVPSEISNAFIASDHIEDSDDDTPGETTDESDTSDTIMLDASVTDNVSLKTTESDDKLFPGKKDQDVSVSCQDARTVNPDESATLLPDLKNTKDLQRNKQSKKVTKSLLSRKVKQGNVDHMAPMNKRRRILNACRMDETSSGLLPSWTAPRLENGMSSCSSSVHEITENLSSQVGLCQDKLSSTSSSRGSPAESIENHQMQTLIDLNVPQVSPESENCGFMTESNKDQGNTSKKLDDRRLPISTAAEARCEQQSEVYPRRHSTRNRPPTTRALEALADGYLTVNRKRKVNRPSQHVRIVIGPNESTNSSVDSQMEEAENGVSESGNCNIFVKSQVPAEANDESVSGQ
ncbi:uncharacterized protein LOC105171501 [Sesamum indicum]|uniref:Uncharacterized protein LOC105171501 n=1 Tax=Sesamum indicum TaxID=4182 RepID=A0A6I9TXN6_SESIN|nr:uncharacterized protein LOC105171501 [Sesamum indicum]XP_011090944.1 uncharacterized protein LOC105171501 [Sesamum indicum]